LLPPQNHLHTRPSPSHAVKCSVPQAHDVARRPDDVRRRCCELRRRKQEMCLRTSEAAKWKPVADFTESSASIRSPVIDDERNTDCWRWLDQGKRLRAIRRPLPHRFRVSDSAWQWGLRLSPDAGVHSAPFAPPIPTAASCGRAGDRQQVHRAPRRCPGIHKSSHGPLFLDETGESEADGPTEQPGTKDLERCRSQPDTVLAGDILNSTLLGAWATGGAHAAAGGEYRPCRPIFLRARVL